MFGFWRVFQAGSKARWEWFREKANGPHATLWLALYAILDPMIMPIPTEPFLALVVLANPKRAWFLTLVVSVCALIGALLGYGAALLFYDALAGVLALLGVPDISSLGASFAGVAFGTMFLTAFTPIPDPPLIVAAGVLGVPLITFSLAFFLGRALRFFAVAVGVRVFGMSVIPKLERGIMRGLFALTIFFVILAVGVALLVL